MSSRAHIKSKNKYYGTVDEPDILRDREVVIAISATKNEPGWMTDIRLNALEQFYRLVMPAWSADVSALDVHSVQWYLKPRAHTQRSWDDVPADIKQTFDQLGIAKAEQTVLAGVGAQFDSEMIYKALRQEWKDKGVLFCSMDHAVKEYPDLVKKYFSTVVPIHDNKYAALNSALWSGGSLVYVPAGVHVMMPLQAYFRINAQQFGQFERTLIIAEPGSSVSYVEGCSAPIYSAASLHAAVVEVIALEGAHVRYSTIQNWAGNIYNLVTKRAHAYKDARVEWVDGNFGSKVTMKYPSVILKQEGACANIISVALASDKQCQDAGAGVIHEAPHTRSHILSKSICRQNGMAIFRGRIKVLPGAHNVKSSMQCDTLLLDQSAQAHTYPRIDLRESDIDVGHEASVSAMDEHQLFFLQSRGLSRQQAGAMMINGFIDAFVQGLPMEYALEINRLVALHMDDSIG